MLDILSKNFTEPKLGTTKAVVVSIKSSLTLKHNSINLFAFISPVVFLICIIWAVQYWGAAKILTAFYHRL